MPADRPRAFEYRGDGSHEALDGRWLEVGDHYLDTEPITPADVELVCPVEVTAADVRRSMLTSRHLVYTPRWAPAVTADLSCKHPGEAEWDALRERAEKAEAEVERLTAEMAETRNGSGA